MDLIEKINNELEINHLNDFERLRYIYLECCKIFSFDTRYYYMKYINDKSIENSIFEKKFDLHDITDNLVICHTFCSEILYKLIKEFTYLEAELRTGAHSYIDVKYKGSFWRLDATISDLSRVKMNLNTTGFYTNNINFKEQLEEIDTELGYFYKKYNDIRNMSILNKIEWVRQTIKDSECRFQYSDASFYFQYLTILDGINDKTYFNSDFDFHRLIEIPDYFRYYDLYNNNGEYKLEQISGEEYSKLCRSLKIK